MKELKTIPEIEAKIKSLQGRIEIMQFKKDQFSARFDKVIQTYTVSIETFQKQKSEMEKA